MKDAAVEGFAEAAGGDETEAAELGRAVAFGYLLEPVNRRRDACATRVGGEWGVARAAFGVGKLRMFYHHEDLCSTGFWLM
ncbi:MAG: hypothetical protein ACR2IE_01375 [Candidatus Sumerlaeaceae bacterium]